MTQAFEKKKKTRPHHCKVLEVRTATGMAKSRCSQEHSTNLPCFPLGRLASQAGSPHIVTQPLQSRFASHQLINPSRKSVSFLTVWINVLGIVGLPQVMYPFLNQGVGDNHTQTTRNEGRGGSGFPKRCQKAKKWVPTTILLQDSSLVLKGEEASPVKYT